MTNLLGEHFGESSETSGHCSFESFRRAPTLLTVEQRWARHREDMVSKYSEKFPLPLDYGSRNDISGWTERDSRLLTLLEEALEGSSFQKVIGMLDTLYRSKGWGGVNKKRIRLGQSFKLYNHQQWLMYDTVLRASREERIAEKAKRDLQLGRSHLNEDTSEAEALLLARKRASAEVEQYSYVWLKYLKWLDRKNEAAADQNRASQSATLTLDRWVEDYPHSSEWEADVESAAREKIERHKAKRRGKNVLRYQVALNAVRTPNT